LAGAFFCLPLWYTPVGFYPSLMKRSLFSLLLLLGGIGFFALPSPASVANIAMEVPEVLVEGNSIDTLPVNPGETFSVSITQSQIAGTRGKVTHIMPSFFTNIQINSSSVAFVGSNSEAIKNNACVLSTTGTPSIVCYSFLAGSHFTYTASISPNATLGKSANMYSKISYKNNEGRNRTMQERKLFIIQKKEILPTPTATPIPTASPLPTTPIQNSNPDHKFWRSPFGLTLIKTPSDIPLGKFRAYYLNTKSLKEISPQEIVAEPYLEYGQTGGKIPFNGIFQDQNVGAYWIGDFDFGNTPTSVTFDFSNTPHDTVRLFINGILTYTNASGISTSTQTFGAGKHTIEIEYEGHWYTGTFAMRMFSSNSSIPQYIEPSLVPPLINSISKTYGTPKVLAASVSQSGDSDQGVIHVNIPTLTQPSVLVLSSYSPVKWNLNAADISLIKAIFVYSFGGGSTVTSSQNIPVYLIRNGTIGSGSSPATTFEISQKIGQTVDAFISDVSPKTLTIPALPASSTSTPGLFTPFSVYEWTNSSLKSQYANVVWSTITTTTLEGLTQSVDFYGTRPNLSLREKKSDNCGGWNISYLRKEGGLCIVGYWIEIENEMGLKIDSKSKLVARFAPVENEAEAVSFVALSESNLKKNSNGIPEGHVLRIPGGFLVHLVYTNTFGCGVHEPTGVIFQVSQAGEITKIAYEKLRDPRPGERVLCVD